MSDRRRGLGRGLGALIPTSSEGSRPVDVFFPNSAPANDGPGESTVSLPTLVLPETDRVEGTDGEAGSPATSSLAGPGGAPGRESAHSGAKSAQELRVAGSRRNRAAAGKAAASSKVASTGNSNPTDAKPTTEVSVGVAEGSPQSDASLPQDTETLGEATSQAAESSGTADVPRETEQDDVGVAKVPRETSGAEELVPVPGATFAELPIDSIHPNARQPRTVFDEGDLDELIGSIRQIGVLQPIVVRAEGDGFELIMGERRWRASRAAGLENIPAIIRTTDDADMLRDALLENLHRAALNPLEEAAAYRQLLDDFGCTHEELASRISRSRPQISNTLRLLKLPPLVQRRVAAGVLSAGHARALLSLEDPAAAEQLAQRIVAEGLSVRATEEIVALGAPEKKTKRPPRAGQRIQAIEELSSRLSDRFETRVKVNLGKSKGRLTVEFASVEDLNRILDVMAPQDPGVFRDRS